MATDSSSRIADLLRGLEAWLREHRPRYAAGLHPAATPDELRDLEGELGRPVPESLAELLRWHNGQAPGFLGGFEGDWMLLSSERIAAAKRLLDADAASTGWQRDWIPFLDDDDGDYLCLDAGDPAEAVRAFWLGKREHPILAASLADWLAGFVTNVENGKYVEEPERGTFLRRG